MHDKVGSPTQGIYFMPLREKLMVTIQAAYCRVESGGRNIGVGKVRGVVGDDRFEPHLLKVTFTGYFKGEHGMFELLCIASPDEIKGQIYHHKISVWN